MSLKWDPLVSLNEQLKKRARAAQRAAEANAPPSVPWGPPVIPDKALEFIRRQQDALAYVKHLSRGKP